MLSSYYSKTSGMDGPDLFRSAGYRQGATVVASNQEHVLMDRLPPFLRTLVVTDGTVTKTLEAFYWEPVVVDTLFQETATAEAVIPWLRADPGDEVLVREVRLRGENSGNLYASAFSVLRPSCIPRHYYDLLVQRVIGIGALMRDCGLESYREIMEIGVDQAQTALHIDEVERPRQLSVVYRTYRIILRGEPAMLITERFPWELYR